MHDLAVARDEQRLEPTGIETVGDDIQEISSPSPSARAGMEGAPNSACYTVELCAGSAGLSCSLAEAGFATLSVDHGNNSHRPKSPCVNFDLSQDAGWLLLYEILRGRQTAICPRCATMWNVLQS